MQSFLTRFYDLVSRGLDDPAHSRRLTEANRLADFYQVETSLWERILTASGQESIPGRAETTITIQNGVEFYRLPGNFRQFLRMERRFEVNTEILTVTAASYDLTGGAQGEKAVVLTAAFAQYIYQSGDLFRITSPTTHAGDFAIASMGSSNGDNAILLATSPGADDTVTGVIVRPIGDPNQVLETIGTIGEYEPGPGVVIISALRGMRVQPAPAISEDQRWTLVYQKGPIIIHDATAAAVGTRSIKFGTPGSTSGEKIAVDGYYNGSLMRVYDATIGAPQTGEVVQHESTRGLVLLRHVWQPTPTGTVKYEVAPVLPYEYDQLYAIEVALRNSQRRRNRRWQDLLDQRKEMTNAAFNYFLSNTADRAPSRNLPPREWDDNPYDGFHAYGWY
jgi:hypothetical protein